MAKIVETRNDANRYSKDGQYQPSKLSVNIQSVFKKSPDSQQLTVRRTLPLIVSAKDLECRCPKLKPNKLVNTQFIIQLIYNVIIRIQTKTTPTINYLPIIPFSFHFQIISHLGKGFRKSTRRRGHRSTFDCDRMEGRLVPTNETVSTANQRLRLNILVKIQKSEKSQSIAIALIHLFAI